VWSREAGSDVAPKLRIHVETPDTGPPAPGDCGPGTVTFSSALVPSCGVMWGAVANAFGNRPDWPVQGPDSHRRYETAIGRTFGIYSHYYSAESRFPRPDEIALTREAGNPRVLYANWKIASGMTFADVAAGRADTLIDAQAAHLKANYPEKLFVSIQSEMEWQVNPTPGSGRTAADYARMYRHVVDRMRAKGVRNIIWVISYGGYAKWATKPWFPELYPGDAYVDWISWHPYATAWPVVQDFAGLVNSTYGSTDPAYPGMYRYLTRRHPGKPLMLGEFGIFHDPRNAGSLLSRKAAFYTSVKNQLAAFPAIKAIINFDTDYDEHKGNGYDITVLSNADNRAAFTDLSRQPHLVNPVPQTGAVR
jgi:beta-mannanase